MLASDPLVLVAPPTHALARQTSVSRPSSPPATC